MGDSRLGNQLADDSHREKHQILINNKLKRKNSMEERKLNEKESLELIAQMIQNTKNRLETNCDTKWADVDRKYIHPARNNSLNAY